LLQWLLVSWLSLLLLRQLSVYGVNLVDEGEPFAISTSKGRSVCRGHRRLHRMLVLKLLIPVRVWPLQLVKTVLLLQLRWWAGHLKLCNCGQLVRSELPEAASTLLGAHDALLDRLMMPGHDDPLERDGFGSVSGHRHARRLARTKATGLTWQS